MLAPPGVLLTTPIRFDYDRGVVRLGRSIPDVRAAPPRAVVSRASNLPAVYMTRSMRHHHPEQALGIHHVVLLDDAISMKEKRGQRVGLVCTENPRPIVGHCVTDIVEDQRRERPVPHRVVAGARRHLITHELWARTLNEVGPVAKRASPLRKDDGTLNGVKAYVGSGWRWVDCFETSMSLGGLKQYIPDAGRVDVLTLERFVARANGGQL